MSPGARAAARRIGVGTRKPANWVQLVKFGTVGASGYVVNLAVFAGLVAGLGVHHIPAAVGAFCVAVSNNFAWNRIWTFRDTAAGGHAGFQAARFFAVSVGALGVNLVALAVLVDLLGAPELPGQALAVAIAMPVNFVGNKLWTFDPATDRRAWPRSASPTARPRGSPRERSAAPPRTGR